MGGRQEVRVTGGRLFSSSKTSQESGHRLENDVQQSRQPPLLSRHTHHLSLLLEMWPCDHTAHPSSVPRPSSTSLSPTHCRPCPATFIVRTGLPELACAEQGMDAVSVNWVK